VRTGVASGSWYITDRRAESLCVGLITSVGCANLLMEMHSLASEPHIAAFDQPQTSGSRVVGFV